MQVNIRQAKANWEELVRAAEAGEHVVICRNKTSVAELVRVKETVKSPKARA